MEKRSIAYPLIVFGGLLAACFIFAIVLFSTAGKEKSDPNAWTEGKGPKIGVVDVSGVISDSKQALRQLIELRRDKDIKAIVVRIDSPGGSVAPSQELFRAIQRTRKDKKVVVSMGTVAASGGYYIAAAADRIYALPGTITGSIGVISEFPEVDGLLDLLHVKATTIKSGALKDIGSPLRPITDAERTFLQGFVNNIYEQFLGDVATARKIDKDELRKVADGRIMTGQEALAAKLVDELGNFEEALEGAAKLAGATPDQGDPVPVFTKPRRSLIGDLIHDGAEGAADGAKQMLRGAGGGTVEARDPRL